MVNRKLFQLDYLFILRPLILIPCWDFLLIGVYLAVGKNGFTRQISVPLLIYTFIMGGVYILNQIMDIETDTINKKLFLLSGGYVTKMGAYIEMFLIWAVAIALSFRYNAIFIIFIVISLVMGILYSVPPFKLKGKPILDTLSNGIGYGMVNFAVGWLVVRQFEPAMFWFFGPYFLSISAVFINTTIVDMEGDENAGDITTAVFLKEGASYIASTILMAGAICVSILRRDFVCLIPAALSFPLFIYAAVYYFVKQEVSRNMTIASFRVPGVLFTVMTVILCPWYALFLVVLIWIMRVYYKIRFDMTYPTLTSG
ncbi:MAG TPA: UbiA family prenyltransferase [bacterium]